MLIRSGALDVVVIDSVAALTPRAEIEGEMGDTHVGLQARLMSQALRKLTANLNKSNTICIFINQLREKIGVMFGSPETTPGGRALKFYSSVRLDIRRIESIKDGVEVVGNRTRVKVVKNKVAPPFRQAEFDIMYGKGISREGSLLDIGVDLGIVKKSGAWYTYEGEQLGQGRENAKAFLGREPRDHGRDLRAGPEVLVRFPALHVLVCNAGLTLSKRAETAQGIEYLFGVNHLGHFLLVDLLRARLVDSAPSRIVVVSSDMHRIAYRGLAFDDLQSTRRYVSYDVYGKSKLANILFTRELARRLDGTDVTANAVHPGLVKTNFGGEGDTRITQRFVRMLPGPLALDAAAGARTTVYVAASPAVEGTSGGYYVNGKLTDPSRHATDDDAAARLWKISEALITGTEN
jgi:NAD(P)-dependent dehydrogenase (short-subunit alcohol dehydrogenase family)